jgi:hypothetical protein
MTEPTLFAVASALWAMGMQPTREQAQHWANIATQRGATPQQLADAWADWDALDARCVQQVGGAA